MTDSVKESGHDSTFNSFKTVLSTMPTRFIHSWPRAIVHVDGDAFFASCEQAMHPEWKGRPVVTGAERGIVAAASYEAKARGVTRATPLWEVRKKCPDAIIVPSDYESYSLFSKRMFAVMRRYTPTVEEYSIDEAFADITGMCRPLRGSYEEIARRMKLEIESSLGITVSVGVSLTKTLAKIASDWDKPSGVTVVSGRRIEEFLRGMEPEEVWGIGPRTAEYCKRLGIRDALDFARRDAGWIAARFDKPQQETWAELNGEQVFQVATEEKSRYYSISKTRTFTPSSRDRTFVYAQLLKNMENACIKARRHGLAARGAALFLKRQDFHYVGTEISFTRASAYPVEFETLVRRAFQELFRPGTEYRATGAVLLDLDAAGLIQPTLFERPLEIERMKRLYGAVDALAEKYGKHAVHLGGSAAANGGRSGHGSRATTGGGADDLPSYARERGKQTFRKLNRLKGETARQHLAVPVLDYKLK